MSYPSLSDPDTPVLVAARPVLAAAPPLYQALVPFPAACFILALLTDLAYWRTANLMWQNFSDWLLFAGLVAGGVAVVVGLVDFLVRRRVRPLAPSWAQVIGYAVVLGLAFLNSLVHAGDGWTAVVPYGLAVSALTVVAMAVIAWIGRSIPAATALE